MRTILVKDFMIPLEQYATIDMDATLYEAVITLEKAQTTLEPSHYRHRALLLLDKSGDPVSKLTMKNIMIALEPNYGKVEGMNVRIRSGYSTEYPDTNSRVLEAIDFVKYGFGLFVYVFALVLRIPYYLSVSWLSGRDP